MEYAYYQQDSNYLYLRLECYGLPGSNWPSGNARYKWFIDLHGDLRYSGGNIIGAEYLLFVEDTDDNVCTSQIAVTVNAPVGGEITALSPLAIVLALMSLIKLMIPLTTLLMIIAAVATVLAAYIIRKKKK